MDWLTGQESVRSSGKSGGLGVASNVGVALLIYRDRLSLIELGGAEEGGVNELAAGGVELGDEGVAGSSIIGLKGAGCRREVARFGEARHVRVAGTIHRYP